MSNAGTSTYLPSERVCEAWPVTASIAGEPTQTQRRLTVGDVALLCWRRRVPAFAAAAVVTLLVLAATMRITPLYEAKAQLELGGAAKVVDFQGGDAPRIDYALVNTVKERLTSSPSLRRAVETSTLRDGPAYREGNPVATLRSRVRVGTSRDSWMIQVALRDENPERAKAGLDALIAAYYESMRERDASRSSSSVEFLRGQVADSTKLYEQARQAEEQFRAANGITSDDPEDNPYGRRLLELDRARIALAAQGSALTAVASQVEKAESVTGDGRLAGLLAIDAMAKHPAVSEQRQLLAKAQGDLGVLARQYGAKHPKMQEASEQVAVRTQQLDAALVAAGLSLKAGREEVRLQQEVLDGRIAEEEGKLAQYRTDLSRMQALSQEATTQSRMLDELRRRLAEQEVASRIETSQVAVASPSEASYRPANVFPSLFLAAALLLGACAGVGGAFAAESLDRRVRGADALHIASGAPLLASIPSVSGGVPRLAAGRGADQPVVVADAFEGLRTSLRLASQYREAAPHAGRCLVVTGSGPREGSSTVASRLAVSLAATGSRVLLVDADLRSPSLHDQFGEHRNGGFSMLLAGEPQHAAHTRFPRLDLLAAGQRPPHPSDLLHSPVLGWYLGEARKRYDWIICDTPSVNRFSDALVIGEHADGVVLVARDGVSLRSSVGDAARKLRSLDRKLVGTVLTAARKAGGSEHAAPVIAAERPAFVGMAGIPALTGARS